MEKVFEWCRKKFEEFDAQNAGARIENISKFQQKPNDMKKIVDPKTGQYIFISTKDSNMATTNYGKKDD